MPFSSSLNWLSPILKVVKPYDIIVAYLGLGTMACVPIRYGSKASVDAAKVNGGKDVERVSHSDALWFPLIASCVLVGFYLLFQYFSKEYINYLLTAYFGIFGVISLIKLLDTTLSPYLLSSWNAFYEHTIVINKRGEELPVVKFMFNAPRIVYAVGSIVFMLCYVWTKHWALNNLLAMSFALTAISLMHLDSFRTGFLMLSLLFAYDIFWVFKTDVMVTVAKAFDVPVKLLMPRNIMDYCASRPQNVALLGLGDIVIPGIFVALCHRFDAEIEKGNKFKRTESWSYFQFCFTAYIIGLITTVAVMHVFKAAQPALLYLSPACILSVLLCAFLNGHLEKIWAFSTEEPEVEKKTVKNKGASGADKESTLSELITAKTEELESSSASSATSSSSSVQSRRSTRRKAD